MTKFQERVRLNAFLVASLNKAGVSAKITAATKTTADCNGKVVELEAVNGEQYICRCGGITRADKWKLVGQKFVLVDGTSIKADTWYHLVSGEVKEV